MSGESDFDIAVIGAGAAGVAAARRLHNSACKFVVLEARDRIGGRTHTVNYQNTFPLDLGAGWLHSANHNPLSALADELQFTLDKTPPPWNPADQRPRLQPERMKFAGALRALEERLEAAAKTGVDRPASELFEKDCSWNPLLDAFSTFYNGAEFDQISVLDYGAYEDTEVNWRVAEGYGSLITALGKSLPISTDTPVSAVDLTGKLIVLETSRGKISARAVIVTLPTNLLAEERMIFRPALPEKIAAAAHLPLGLANKLFLGVRTPATFPQNEQLFGRLDRTEICAYHLRPFGRAYIEVYCGGRHAHELERAGKDAASAFAIDELAGLLGSDIRKELTPLISSAWGLDPFAHGSYSHALPGYVEERKRLAENVEGRLFFAGEACSVSHFSTVHGAYETGTAAAGQALQSLNHG